MLALLFALSTAHAQDALSCEATDGSGLVYETWSKSGGAYPGPDTLMHTASWRLGDTVLYSKASSYGAGETVTGTLDWRWKPEDTDVEAVLGNQMHRTTTYTASVELFTRDGSRLPPPLNAPRVTVPMRCVRVDVCCIP